MNLMSKIKHFFGFDLGAELMRRRAKIIANLADESASENRALNAQLRVYTRADDPFMAMMADLHNKRTAMKMARGE